MKISEMPAASAANATDQLEANQAGFTRRVTVTQLQATMGGSYLPLAGGALAGPGNLTVAGTLGVTGALTGTTATMSGALTGTSATMSGTVTTPVVSGGAATLVLNAPTGQRVSKRINNVSIVETQNNAMYPGTTNTIALGATTNRWATVASVLGDFTGALTGTTATFTGNVTLNSTLAVGAGAATQAFVKASSTANLGIYYGTGAPAFTAAKGSLYSNTTATTTTTRLFVNTDGAATWASLTTSA